MLAVMALEDHGLKTDQGEVLVTGAAGGVGLRFATAILANLGYEVAAVTGTPRTGGLPEGAGRRAHRCARGVLNETVKAPAGGRDLGRLCRCGGRRDAGPRAGADEIRGLRRGGGGLRVVAGLPATVIPFLFARREPAGHRQRDAALRQPPARLGAHRA